ncbi:MAG: universal stress protein [Rhodospirillaceae bacterium]|jgi:nucleotide-binding universal stress UspA family protein|nr:universal stress protein [Rhodospirillaceae bacterium]MBT5455981.1 universal stress protein [Rhodospirillaceae bacterium]
MMFGNKNRRHGHDVQDESEAIRQQRQKRFRILVCIDGSDASYDGLRFASKIGHSHECDIILLYVRPIDQGLRTGGLQVRVARENMLDWGLELPGIRYLKQGLDMLADEKDMAVHWTTFSSHTDTWGDPLGDNKVEYRHESGKSIVLKLKTAPDPASGILDQYEPGPYNLIIMGAPSRWHSEVRSFFNAGATQKVAMLAPCSVMVARADADQNGRGHLICTDGTKHSLDAMRRDAVLAQHSGFPITLFTVARQRDELKTAERVLEKATEMLGKIEIDVAGTEIGLGDPREQIVKIGNDYSVIVVADSGKSWFHRLFVSGVAFNVMGASKTSVLNVR